MSQDKSQVLHQLVYISRNEIEGNDERLQKVVEQILAVARQSNEEKGITGALMFNAGCFAQVLEGERDHLQETFERIQADSRHSNIVILDFKPIEQKRFDKWSMAYVGVQKTSLQLFEAIAHNTNFEAEQFQGEHVYDVLQQHLKSSERIVEVFEEYAATPEQDQRHAA